MLEVKVTLEVPGLPEAINNLAAAVAGKNTQQAVATQPTAQMQTSPVTAQPTVPSQPVTPIQVNPTIAPTAPNVSVPTVTPIATTPAVNTQASAPSTDRAYTLVELSNAGAALCEHGKMPQLVQLLAQFGVQTVTQVKPEQYAALAAGLKQLGANL